MWPVRMTLNFVYALLTRELDSKQRREFDDGLYGWADLNAQADRALRQGIDESGGEG